MSRKAKILIGFGLYLVILGVLVFVVGSDGKNDEFQPQNEFFLDPWITIDIAGIDLSINKAVLYLLLATVATIGSMIVHREPDAARAEQDPDGGRALLRPDPEEHRRGQPRREDVARWFPFLATLFFFIWFSNMIGYLPLPTNTEHPIDVFGVEIPAFALYAATANLSIPLVLTLVVWGSYHVEGVRAKGFFPYLASWLPPGLENMNIFAKAFFFGIEAISHVARLISLSVRLFANILAGHLLLLFMGGGLAVLLGRRCAGPLHPAPRLPLLPPGGGPDRHASGLHLRDPDRHLPWRRNLGNPLIKRQTDFRHTSNILLLTKTTYRLYVQEKRSNKMDFLIPLAEVTDDGLKSIALGVGAGLGSIGAGIGIGIIFGAEIESVARQPEMKDELQQIRWLGFALTEAVAFYTFIFGLIAFFL